MPGKDHRTRVTKMLIRRAFTDLLRVKPVQSISIKELCEKAGVNRGTFYAHYASVHDLLMQMEDEMLSRDQRGARLAPARRRRGRILPAHLHGAFSVPQGQRRPLHRDAGRFWRQILRHAHAQHGLGEVL